METIYQGIRLSPEEIARAACDEDVDALGLSVLSGAHMALVPAVIEGLRLRSGYDAYGAGLSETARSCA